MTIPRRWVVVAALMMPVAAQAQTQADTLAIEHVTVIPMVRDTALADHTVLIWEGRIGWIGPSRDARVPARSARVDGGGQWLIPGLADMHVHLDRFDDLPRYLEAGVTTVRNMRGRPEHLVWRADIERGVLVGPTIFTSGPTCCRRALPFMTNPAFVRIRTAADADSLARQQARAGYDMLKLHSSISVSQFERLTAAAREAGIPVVGHVVPEIGLTKSLSSGQVSLEHADGLVEGDSAAIGGAFGAIARSGAWVGTIISSRNGQCGPPRPSRSRNIAAFRRAGVQLLAGSDAGLEPIRPGLALHCELATLVAAGLTPYQALATTTIRYRRNRPSHRVRRTDMNPRLAVALAVVVLPTAAVAQPAQAPADAPASLVVSPANEPGTPLRISGLVNGPDGVPLARASIYVYQTDAAGIYNPANPRDSDHPRLNGHLRTDARGRFSYTTVRPGSYPGTRNPGHIHYHVNAPGFAERVFEIVFEGDSLIPAQWRRDAANPLAAVAIVRLTAGANGALAGEHTVALRPSR